MSDQPHKQNDHSRHQKNLVYYVLVPRRVVIWIIRLYQKTISPDHGVYGDNPIIGCRYYPTCSEYAVRAVDRHGVIRGGLRAVWRIVRCNPFSPGGVDESYK